MVALETSLAREAKGDGTISFGLPNPLKGVAEPKGAIELVSGGLKSESEDGLAGAAVSVAGLTGVD